MALRIRHLRIEDFRAFLGTHEFDFGADPEQHVELISGPNASGKSTIIEALKLCFFGDQNEKNIRTYVNQQLVDDIEVDEKVSARIIVELVDPGSPKYIRITREVSTLKTPTGKKDIVESPVVESREKGGDWGRIENPEEYLAQLIPSQARPFSFFNPEQILGLDTWEDGASYQELVQRAQLLRNRAAHDMGLEDSASVDVSREYLESINQTLTKMETSVEVDESEEYLTIGSQEGGAKLLSKGKQILISFGLVLAAGELNGVEAPVIMDMPFARVSDEILDDMCELLREVDQRQILIIGLPMRLNDVAETLDNVVASYHRLRVYDNSTVGVDREF